MRNYLFKLLMLCCTLLVAGTAHAGLIGEQVTGGIYFASIPTNYFDPSNGYVPSGYLNTSGATVTIGTPAVEFGFLDGANLDTADFTDTQLTVTDHVYSNASNWEMTFLSTTPGLFQGLAKVGDNFPNGGITYSISGDTIELFWSGTGSSSGDFPFSATFDVQTSGVPEPATLFLLVPGLLVLGKFARRTRRYAAAGLPRQRSMPPSGGCVSGPC